MSDFYDRLGPLQRRALRRARGDYRAAYWIAAPFLFAAGLLGLYLVARAGLEDLGRAASYMISAVALIVMATNFVTRASYETLVALLRDELEARSRVTEGPGGARAPSAEAG